MGKLFAFNKQNLRNLIVLASLTIRRLSDNVCCTASIYKEIAGDMSTEDSRVDLIYHATNVTNEGASLHIRIEPDDKTVQLLVLVRYKAYPALRNMGNETRGWDFVGNVPSSYYQICQQYCISF